jgi:hypothetical protein
MTDHEKDNPMNWRNEGYCVFDAVRGEPMVFKIEHEEGVIERAMLITRTEEAGRDLVRKVFGEAALKPNYPDRFPVRSMPLDSNGSCMGAIRDLVDFANPQAFYDGEHLWWVKDLKVS